MLSLDGEGDLNHSCPPVAQRPPEKDTLEASGPPASSGFAGAGYITGILDVKKGRLTFEATLLRFS